MRKAAAAAAATPSLYNGTTGTWEMETQMICAVPVSCLPKLS